MYILEDFDAFTLFHSINPSCICCLSSMGHKGSSLSSADFPPQPPPPAVPERQPRPSQASQKRILSSSSWVCPGSPPHRICPMHLTEGISRMHSSQLSTQSQLAPFDAQLQLWSSSPSLPLFPLPVRSHRKRKAHSLQLHSFSHYPELVEVFGGT